MTFEAAVAAALKTVVVLRTPLRCVHMSNGPMPVANFNHVPDLANEHNPAGLYLVKDTVNGAAVLEDLASEIHGFRKRQRNVIVLPPLARVGVVRDMYRMSCARVTAPSLNDLWHDYSANYVDYRRTLATELAKYCDAVLIINYGWCLGWSELVLVGPISFTEKGLNNARIS